MSIGKINLPKQIDAKLENLAIDAKEAFLQKLSTKSAWDVAGRSTETVEASYENIATTNYQDVEKAVTFK